MMIKKPQEAIGPIDLSLLQCIITYNTCISLQKKTPFKFKSFLNKYQHYLSQANFFSIIKNVDANRNKMDAL